ncbi:hypothetical protein ACTM6F_19865 [Citrobacter freundii]
MTTNNHPAHGPVSLDRLHQIREILSKAAAQSDGGNLGYAMADAVKVIDGSISAFDADPQRNPVLAYADSYRDMAKRGVESIPVWSVIADLERNIAPLYATPPSPVVPDDVLDALQKVARIRLDLNDFDGDRRGIADCLGNAEEALIEVVNRSAAMLQGAEPASQPYTLPPLDYLDTVKFNADCAIQDPDSIYTNEFFLSLDEVFGEMGNYSEPVQAKAVSMLIAEIFMLRGYSPAEPQQE